MSDDRQPSGLDLANRASSALDGGDYAAGARLAAEAAAAFLDEQGEPNFDAPNMLGMRTEALLTLGDHAGAAQTLDRAEAFAAKLPAGEPFDSLRVRLGRLRGVALLDGGDRPGARAMLLRTLELCEATVGADGADAAALHNMLGIVGKFTGTFDSAAEHYARALEIYERLEAAPAVIATLHHNLGGLAHSRGDLETAERETRRALEMRTRVAWSRPPGHGRRSRPARRDPVRARPPRGGRARAAAHGGRTSPPPSVRTISRSRSPTPRSARPCTGPAASTRPTRPTARVSPRASARRVPSIRCWPPRC